MHGEHGEHGPLQVLRWMGYFIEGVPESPAEDVRVRRVVVRAPLLDVPAAYPAGQRRSQFVRVPRYGFVYSCTQHKELCLCQAGTLPQALGDCYMHCAARVTRSASHA